MNRRLDDALDTVRADAGPADPAEVVARVAWSIVVEPGDAVAGDLVEGLGADRALRTVLAAEDDGVGAVLHACDEAGLAAAEDEHGLGAVLVAALRRWRPRLRRLDVEPVLTAARAVGARLVVPGDPDWPTRVDDLGPHAPLLLWVRDRAGEVLGARPAGSACALTARPALAVVGSRANTVAGAEAAAEITSVAADAGCTIVSGGAYGIDAVAHRVAIAADAPTLAVMAGGIDQLYPSGNVDLLHRVARTGGVVAETPPGTRPSRWRFLARNRLIAALADCTVVVEAGARSGALNTAHHAGQLGRPVFAVPGAFASSASVGCHRLVAQGRAQLAVHPGDPASAVVEAVSPARSSVHPEPLRPAVDDPDVTRVVDALGRRPIGTEEIARRSGMSTADVTDALALAELLGLVQHEPSGWTA